MGYPHRAGQENAREFLKNNPELTLELENRLREAFNLPVIQEAASGDKKKPSKGKGEWDNAR